MQETLYPLAPAFDPVSRWFLDPPLRQDDDLVARLRAGALRDDDVHVGVMHADNERESRGGFSLYVPEAWDGRASMPLVVALHGGSGHGRDFLWSWLREARGRGVLVLSPTAQGRTWSIMGGGDLDAESLKQAIESVAGRYPVDRSRVLLTGMSDGRPTRCCWGCATARRSRIWRRPAGCSIRCCSPRVSRRRRGGRSI